VIASTAIVDPSAVLGEGVSIGHGSVVHPGTILGAGTTIGEHCSIGIPAGEGTAPLRIGEGSTVRSHAAIYAGSELGPELETGHHVVIRAGSKAGANLRLGSFSALEGDLEVGDYVRLHGYVHVGSGSRIGDFAWVYSLTTLTNDPLPPSDLHAAVSIGAAAVVCVGATLLPGSQIGDGAFVAAGARVAGDVPAGRVVNDDGSVGGHVSGLVNLETGLRHPWMRHFTERYPEHVRPRLAALLEQIMATRFAAQEA
jgi:UDP-3-O-[3-hydroxymyristoyl] glucosamine N-acyltransferase